MFFENEVLPSRKRAALRALPAVPNTGWSAPSEPPNLAAAVALGMDTETFDPELNTAGPGWARGPKGHIVGVSLAACDRAGNRGQWYFPLRHTVEPETNLDPGRVFPWLKTVLETPVPKIGTNLLYDAGWLTEENIYLAGELHDVQFAEALLDETALVALDVLSYKYLKRGKQTSLLYDWIREAYRPNESEIRAEIYRAPPRLVGPYAEIDAANPLDIIQKQWPLLNAENLGYVYRLECDLIPLLVRMRRDGVTVDVEAAIKLKEELEIETRELYEKLYQQYGVRIEKVSAGEVAKIFDSIGIKYPKTSAEKPKPSFQKEWLAALEHPIGDEINEIREHEKMCGTFLQSYIIDKNVKGKLFPQFHPLKSDDNGTLVGRFASSDPNLQNVPSRTKLGKKVRIIVKPDTGHHCWQKNDYSQIHYRILADQAVDNGDGSADALRKRYNDNPNTDYHRDVYLSVAPLMSWDTSDEKHAEFVRRPIKNVNFGLLYGQSLKSLMYKTATYFGGSFTAAQGKQFFEAYFTGAPYVKPTMKNIGQEVQRFGYITTVLGRRVRFKLWEPNSYGERGYPLPYEAAIREYGSNIRRAYEYRGVNYKFQGTEPDIMKHGMRDCLRSGVYDYVGVPRITVHDELGFSVRDDTPQSREAFAFIQRTMQDTIKLRVPVKVDVNRGPNWGETK